MDTALPTTPEQLFAALDRLGIAHPTVRHPPLFTVEQSQSLRGSIAGGHTKNIVGLPDKAVSEAKERVRAALVASGLALPARRITINLAPADLPKEGSHYDLPIALGLMAAIGAVPHDALAGFTVLGELGLDGSIAAVAGCLPAAIGANSRNEGLICPAASGPEAAWASPEMEIVAPSSLIQLACRGQSPASAPSPKPRRSISPTLRARRVPSARSRSPPPVATTCS